MENDEKHIIRCDGKGAINIALIKYWGKEDEDEIIPLNNSVSLTLDTSTYCTKTSVEVFDVQGEDELFLNGQ